MTRVLAGLRSGDGPPSVRERTREVTLAPEVSVDTPVRRQGPGEACPDRTRAIPWIVAASGRTRQPVHVTSTRRCPNGYRQLPAAKSFRTPMLVSLARCSSRRPSSCPGTVQALNVQHSVTIEQLRDRDHTRRENRPAQPSSGVMVARTQGELELVASCGLGLEPALPGFKVAARSELPAKQLPQQAANTDHGLQHRAEGQRAQAGTAHVANRVDSPMPTCAAVIRKTAAWDNGACQPCG